MDAHSVGLCLVARLVVCVFCIAAVQHNAYPIPRDRLWSFSTKRCTSSRKASCLRRPTPPPRGVCRNSGTPPPSLFGSFRKACRISSRGRLFSFPGCLLKTGRPPPRRAAEREVARIGTEIRVSKALPLRAATDGETASAKFTGAVQLSSGKFVIVERSHEFTLVPWRPVIDRQLGREVMGAVQGGSVSWQLRGGRALSPRIVERTTFLSQRLYMTGHCIPPLNGRLSASSSTLARNGERARPTAAVKTSQPSI